MDVTHVHGRLAPPLTISETEPSTPLAGTRRGKPNAAARPCVVVSASFLLQLPLWGPATHP